MRLDMDFRWERAEGSLHVLNAVSPGLTCALPMGEHLARSALSGVVR